MPTHQIVGFGLLVAAVFDAAMLPLVRARIRDDGQRALVTVSLISSALLIAGLGVAFLTGAIGIPA